MKEINHIEQLFFNRGGILHIQELQDAGISYYFLKKLLRKNLIRRLKQGVYIWQGDEVDEWQKITKIIPKGIFCLHSAANLHELSTFVPSEYHLAIPWKSKVTLTDYPPVSLYYWKDPQYVVGLSKLALNGLSVPVYDKEKTLCDFLKFRNKVGMDAAKEVIKTYLASTDRNIQKVMEYSRELKIYSIAQQYLEILI